MARTTAAQFARQLRRLGATVITRDGYDVIASYRSVEVTAQFAPDIDAFDVARRTDTAADDAANLISSMAGVRRVPTCPSTRWSRSAPPAGATPASTSWRPAGSA